MRKQLTSLALVGVLLGLALGPVTAAPRVATTDWSGTYDGQFPSADFGTAKIHTNAIHLEVTGLDLKGGIQILAETTGTGSNLNDFSIGVCSLAKVDLAGSELKGVPVPGDEVSWTGPVTIAIGAGDPLKVDCRTIGPTKSQPGKLDVTVGSNGLRGTLTLGTAALTFTAARTHAPAPSTGGGAPGPSSAPPDSGGTGAGTTSTDQLLGDLVRNRLGKAAADNVLSRVDPTTDFGRFDVAEIHQLDGLAPGTANDVTHDLIQTAALLGEASTGKGPKGETLAAFPNVRALAPVFWKLAAHAVGPPADASATRTLRRLLELAIALDTAP